MAKKRSKKPATSRMVVRPTEAPMMLARPASEPEVVEKAAPDHAEIARLAFAKFAARGYVHGSQMEDWLAAEAELAAR